MLEQVFESNRTGGKGVVAGVTRKVAVMQQKKCKLLLKTTEDEVEEEDLLLRGISVSPQVFKCVTPIVCRNGGRGGSLRVNGAQPREHEEIKHIATR